MLKWTFYTVAALLAVAAAYVIFTVVRFARLDDPAAAVIESAPVTNEELDGARNLAELLEPIRREFKLPALAAAVVKDGRTAALGRLASAAPPERSPSDFMTAFISGRALNR